MYAKNEILPHVYPHIDILSKLVHILEKKPWLTDRCIFLLNKVYARDLSEIFVNIGGREGLENHNL